MKNLNFGGYVSLQKMLGILIILTLLAMGQIYLVYKDKVDHLYQLQIRVKYKK